VRGSKKQDNILTIQPEAKNEIVTKTMKTKAMGKDITHAKEQQTTKQSGGQDTITGRTLNF
jgi:hypothetical protein